MRDDLIREYAHLPFVAARGIRSIPSGLERDDLVGAGNLGLTLAAERFDVALGVPFAAFALVCIRRAIIRALQEWDFYPRTAREAERRGEIECPDVLSLEDRRGEFTLGDTLAGGVDPQEAAISEEEAAARDAAISRLPDRDRCLIEMRYVEQFSFAEIAVRMAISKQRVHQIHQRALERLREHLG